MRASPRGVRAVSDREKGPQDVEFTATRYLFFDSPFDEPRALVASMAGGRHAASENPPVKTRMSESFRLHFGPYRAPRCRVGKPLDCEARGRTVEVAGLSDASIQWPYAKKRGNRSLILCGDLIKAVGLESETAVAHHWGVSATTDYLWRRALGVPGDTIGSVRLRRHYLAIGRPISRLPESRAKMSAARANMPLCPQFRAAAAEAAKRPKSEAWKKALSERMKMEWSTGARRRSTTKSRGAE